MTRALVFAVLLLGILSTASRADVEVAPPPRPAGVPLTPPPPPAKAEDPAETVGKIIKNSKDVTDKLAKNDTGTDTRKTQDETLTLIDSLINRQENPPPDDKDKKDDKQDKSDDKKDDQKQKSDDQPKDGKGGEKGMKDSDGMGQPKGGGMGGGMGQQKSGRKPRAESGKESGGWQPKEPGGMKDGGKQPKGGTTGTQAGVSSGGKPPKPSLPVDDDVAKDVWGHLPDKLRQQVTQYYKEEFMPRYADLLKQYYSSLSEKGAKPFEKK